MRKVLSDDALATATAVIDKHRTMWNESLATVIGDQKKMAQTKQKLRKSAEQSLRRDVPNYDAIKALRQQFSTDYQAVVTANPPQGDGRLAVHPTAWADGVDNFGMLEFERPFEAVELLPFPDDGEIESNRSVALPELGWAHNDITWRDDNTFGEIYDLDTWCGNDVSVGINFAAPQSGFLNVAVNMESLFNWIHVSGSNNFGFSSATVNVSHYAFILLLRDNNRFMSFRQVISNGWVNPSGDDFSHTFSNFPAGPVVFVAEFDDALHAGEQVQILGGSQTFISSDVSNMDCSATVKVLWQINRLYVWLT